MTEAQKKELKTDKDGLLTYEYIANNIDTCLDDMDFLVDNMIEADATGQFLVSAARYLNAIDPTTYAGHISRLVESAIDKDRERRYLGDLLSDLYGADYREHADELTRKDNNFRRIYKRLFPTSGI